MDVELVEKTTQYSTMIGTNNTSEWTNDTKMKSVSSGAKEEGRMISHYVTKRLLAEAPHYTALIIIVVVVMLSTGYQCG